IKGTSVANLNPIQDRGSGNNTLPGNSNWFEWQWPTMGEFSGCIKARNIPGI
ncbi:21963_t:CDS:1, partial [Dentiscutata erythropus]